MTSDLEISIIPRKEYTGWDIYILEWAISEIQFATFKGRLLGGEKEAFRKAFT